MRRRGEQPGKDLGARVLWVLRSKTISGCLFALALIMAGCFFTDSGACSIAHAAEAAPQAMPPVPRGETPEEAQRQSVGCVSCHTATDSASMHPGSTVIIGCADCHGGDANVMAAGAPKSAEYVAATRKAHVPPRFVE